jgi:transcriptional regulator with XRE-family HTH domain
MNNSVFLTNGSIGKTVKKLRFKKGYSQKGLANKCGFHREFISTLENHKRLPSLNTLAILAQVFNLKVYELIYQMEKEDK